MARLRELMGGSWLLPALVAVIGWFYLWTAIPVWKPSLIGPSSSGYYNLLMRGFTKGHLSLDLPADPLLAKMSNPSDPAERGEHGLHDASYYKGRYYLYFGAAPVILLFLPFHLLTHAYIDESLAVVFFAFVGLIWSVCLLLAVRRRYFPTVSQFATLGCVMALGLANMMPLLLRRADVWEVPITCGYDCLMAGFFGLFQALHGSRRAAWLAFASASFGMAVASRPTYLFGCGAVLVPIIAYRLERRGDPPDAWDRGYRRLVMAGVYPLAGIGLLMAAYNELRFGSPFDFGFRHLMNGEPVWKEDLFALRFFWYNFRVYAFAPAHWVPYFPYASVAKLPVSPAGHLGSEDPFGVLPNIPFVLLSGIALVLSVREAPWARGLRNFSLAVAIAAIGTGLATSSFGGAINRYEVDFVPSLVVLACLGWFALVGTIGPRPTARRLVVAAVAVLLAFSVAFNVLASFGHNQLLRVEHPALYRRIAHRWNRISLWLGELRGIHYGPVEMEVVFPEDKVGQAEPLLVTGCSFMSDYLVVHYDGPGRVTFALEHSSYGHFLGPQLEIKAGVSHKVLVEMGSLYPPPEHPFFDGLTPAETELCQKTMRVTVDGMLALERDIPFYDAASLQPSIGNSGDRPGFTHPFSGRIISWTRRPIDLAEAGTGPVIMKAQFPGFTGLRTEPLVSSGVPGRGDLVFVRYLGPDTLSFGYDHPGTGEIESAAVKVDYASMHSIEVDSGAFEGLDGPAGEERPGRLSLRLDGRTVFYESQPFFSCGPESVTVGVNRNRSPVAVEMFRGQILETRRLGLHAPAAPEGTYGPVDLELRMPEGAVDPQPLVTTGRTGAGDALSIRWSAPGLVRLVYDHWGAGVVESGDIPLVAGSAHTLGISIPSLLAPGGTQVERMLRQNMLVTLDGATVWTQIVASHPALSTEAYFGSNAIGASSCDREFAKGISWFERKPEKKEYRSGRGAVVLQLKLPRGAAGRADPLLTVGRTGRADVLVIRYLDDSHVGFAIDHWGKTFKASDPVAVDFDRPHEVVIQMPNLDPAVSEAEIEGEAQVRLDGDMVWRITESFYLTNLPVDIAANPIGASSCGPEFTGGLMKVSREAGK
jgi:hypothetical protein